MATRVERTGIEACITKVNAAIEQLIEASSEIETAMNDCIRQCKKHIRGRVSDTSHENSTRFSNKFQRLYQ